MVLCVDAGNFKTKNAFINTLLFENVCPHISSSFIKENASFPDNDNEVKTCGKHCIDVGPVDNNFVTGTSTSSTSAIVTDNDATIYCKQTACKHQHLLTCQSFNNGMCLCTYVTGFAKTIPIDTIEIHFMA